MRELLENAVLSIELGVEDFEADDERRLLSAIRNLYAGVLLLCKQVLWNESPAGSEGALIYKELVSEKQADGTVLMKPKKAHRNTVDRRLIEERFKSLDLELDWDRLIRLANIRNDAEHLFLKATPTVAREVLASAMPLIERLMVEHLEEEPLEVFEDTVWQKLLENREIFDTQQARCRDTFKIVAWNGEIFTRALPFLRCPHCSSPLVRCVETENMAFDNLWIECAECGEEIDREPLFEKAFGDVNDQEAFSVAKDGAMPSVTTCPICDRVSWSRWDRKCVFCTEDQLICDLCETECDPEDYNTLDGLCSSCSWGMQKAMRDD